MAEIKTFNLGKWGDLDEHGHKFCVGMTDAKKAFERLKTHLEANGLLPDEYFRFSTDSSGPNGELLKFRQAICIPNFGETQGIDLDIWLECQAKSNLPFYVKFAAGKMRGETADDYMRMFRIAAECSLMLNGRGFSYERNNVDIVLTEKEAVAVANSVRLDLCGYLEPETEALLSSALDKFKGAPRTTIQTITCHGRNDYSLWVGEIPTDMFRSIVHEAAEKVGTLEEVMSGMAPASGCEMRLLTQMKDGRFAFFTIPERMNGLQDYETQGISTRGSKEQIMAEIFTDWEPAEEPEDELER